MTFQSSNESQLPRATPVLRLSLTSFLHITGQEGFFQFLGWKVIYVGTTIEEMNEVLEIKLSIWKKN